MDWVYKVELEVQWSVLVKFAVQKIWSSRSNFSQGFWWITSQEDGPVEILEEDSVIVANSEMNQLVWGNQLLKLASLNLYNNIEMI